MLSGAIVESDQLLERSLVSNHRIASPYNFLSGCHRSVSAVHLDLQCVLDRGVGTAHIGGMVKTRQLHTVVLSQPSSGLQRVK